MASENTSSPKMPKTPYTAGISEKFFKEYLEYIKNIDQKSIEKCKETIKMLNIPEVDDYGVDKEHKEQRKEWC